MQNLRAILRKSQYRKGFVRSEIQKVHEQKMEKFQQSQQPRFKTIEILSITLIIFITIQSNTI
jgi:hypothetical protein